jgi:hypothetical protein
MAGANAGSNESDSIMLLHNVGVRTLLLDAVSRRDLTDLEELFDRHRIDIEPSIQPAWQLGLGASTGQPFTNASSSSAAAAAAAAADIDAYFSSGVLAQAGGKGRAAMHGRGGIDPTTSAFEIKPAPAYPEIDGAAVSVARRLIQELRQLRLESISASSAARDTSDLALVEGYLCSCAAVGFSGEQMLQAVSKREQLVRRRTTTVAAEKDDYRRLVRATKYRAYLTNQMISRDFDGLAATLAGTSDQAKSLAREIPRGDLPRYPESRAAARLLANYRACERSLRKALVTIRLFSPTAGVPPGESAEQPPDGAVPSARAKAALADLPRAQVRTRPLSNLPVYIFLSLFVCFFLPPLSSTLF